MRHAAIDPELFCAHRRRLAAELPADSLAIVHAADVFPTNGDGVLRLVPAADLFWLTGIEQPESVLVLDPDAVDPSQREMLFLREPSPQLATWEGHSLSREEAQTLTGIQTVRWIASLPATLHGLLASREQVFLNANEHERASLEVENRDLRMARQLITRYPLHQFRRLAPLLRKLRAVKDHAEVDLLRQAISITRKGFDRVVTTLKPGVMEYELEAELIGEFTRNRAGMGYEPIVASGKYACTLHYVANDQACQDGDLILFDVGASYANYSADLTRVFPINGRFTSRQRELYNAVLRVLKTSIERTVVGTSLRDWKRAAQVQMAEELVRLGLLGKDDLAADTASHPACQRYFMHGLGHSLGLGVHDLAPPDGPLEPGWVMTVEPGLYLSEEGIGIRLENDVLVTADGPVDLCADVPLEPDDIEAWMAG
jgi:Xaa-Pro aminopeptidase